MDSADESEVRRREPRAVLSKLVPSVRREGLVSIDAQLLDESLIRCREPGAVLETELSQHVVGNLLRCQAPAQL